MGQTFELEEHGKGSPASASDVEVPPAPDVRYRDRGTEKEIILGYRDELTIYRKQMVDLEDVPLAEIMQRLSSVAARLREIHSDLWDMRSPAAQQLRSRHVDPLRNDLEFHFKLHSRRISDLELEWRMAGGQ